MRTDGLSPLHAKILLAINHTGWFAELWFPTVQRETLDFNDDSPDEDIHDAILVLIRNGRLVSDHSATVDLDLHPPDWVPTAEALELAKQVLQ